MKMPEPGEKIYIHTSLYLDHGEDDVHGGLATISNVELNPNCPQESNRIYIQVKEVPGVSYNYWVLMQEQEKLKERYGDQVAYPDPDYGDTSQSQVAENILVDIEPNQASATGCRGIPLAVNKLGSVHGVSPVSIVSKNANSFLVVYNDDLFRKKAVIYRLNDFRQCYRTLKGLVDGLDHVAFSPSGNVLAAASYFSHFRFSGFVYHVNSDHITPVLSERYYGKASIGGGSQMFAISPDESLMVIASSVTNNSRLRIFDIKGSEEPTGIFTMNPPGRVFETKSLNWSPDGQIIAHHGHYMNSLVPPEKQRGIFLWKVDRDSSSISVDHIGTLRYESGNHDDSMVALDFSPDSRFLVLGADERSSDRLKLFDLQSQQLVFESAPLNSTTSSLLFTPSGRYLFSAQKDGTIYVWSVEPSFFTLYMTIALPGEIYQLCWSDDNKLLAAHQDGKRSVAVSSVALPADMLN